MGHALHKSFTGCDPEVLDQALVIHCVETTREARFPSCRILLASNEVLVVPRKPPKKCTWMKYVCIYHAGKIIQCLLGGAALFASVPKSCPKHSFLLGGSNLLEPRAQPWSPG